MSWPVSCGQLTKEDQGSNSSLWLMELQRLQSAGTWLWAMIIVGIFLLQLTGNDNSVFYP